MAFQRRAGNRVSGAIWPGFVDAITALLMVMIFILTIFMVVQFVLSEEINNQDDELTSLNAQLNALSQALGLEAARSADLESRVATLSSSLSTAQGELAAQAAMIADFEAQVASLIAANTSLGAERDQARAELTESLSAAEALELAVAAARSEIDAAAEAARLAAARRAALEALIADLERDATSRDTRIATLESELSEAEANRLVEAAAAEALRARLENADAELTAMTLALEEQRRRAEETLTLLAAAQAATDALAEADAARAAAMTEAERQAALLAVANAQLAEAEAASAESQRQVALLNEQVAALRQQLGALQGLLDDSAARDAAAEVQIANLGTQLNAALARVAAEQQQLAREQARVAEFEAAEAARLAAEAQELSRYRSEFFGRLRTLLEGREGVSIEGDRFVFSSEVLFEIGSADLAPAGLEQIANVASLLNEVAGEIPDTIDWILRVDGHTDDRPLRGDGDFASNWELSQARALSVVQYLAEELGFPSDRLAATGFGEYNPVATNNTAAGRAQNRRIELKLTER